MADSIVRNSSPTVPIANLVFVTSDYDAAVELENILHKQMNGSGFNVTYKPARLRSGTLRLLFGTAAHAWTAVPILTSSYSFTLTADVSQTSMTFVLRPGELRPRPQGRVWVLEVPFQEV